MKATKLALIIFILISIGTKIYAQPVWQSDTPIAWAYQDSIVFDMEQAIGTAIAALFPYGTFVLSLASFRVVLSGGSHPVLGMSTQMNVVFAAFGLSTDAKVFQ